MIAQVLNRQFILQQVADVLARDVGGPAEGTEVPEDATELQETDYLEAREELRKLNEREAAASSGQDDDYEPPPADRRGEEAAPLDDFSYFSRDPVASVFQSALEEYIRTRHDDRIVEEPPPDDRRGVDDDAVAVTDESLAGVELERVEGRRLAGPFEITDIGWFNSLFAKGIRHFRGTHEFIKEPAPPTRLASRARMIIVGDWGTGIPRARKVADQIRVKLNEGKTDRLEQHVVHLGDVYYSGWPGEYDSRMLAWWPVRKDEVHEITSWNLNGNHDMYSGGWGYWDRGLADPRFAKQAGVSFFSLVSDDWQILGLDTAYKNHDLADPQAGWINRQVDGSQKRLMLLSHHQPFSAYGKDGPRLKAKLGEALDGRPVDAWFWGHEHRCITYKPYEGVVRGRCVGHGGVPVYQWHGKSDPYPPPSEWEARDYFDKGLERWALFGFAVLDFDGPTIRVVYFDENGGKQNSEVIQ